MMKNVRQDLIAEMMKREGKCCSCIRWCVLFMIDMMISYYKWLLYANKMMIL